MTNELEEGLIRMARETLRAEEEDSSAGGTDLSQLLLERRERMALTDAEQGEAETVVSREQNDQEELLEWLDHRLARQAGEERYIP